MDPRLDKSSLTVLRLYLPIGRKLWREMINASPIKEPPIQMVYQLRFALVNVETTNFDNK